MKKLHSQTSFFVSALLFTLLFGLICSAAWISDDSLIMARTAENFINGHGLRYNIAERVQTYTNPLLLLVLSAVSFFTREFYHTLLGLNLAATAAALSVFFFKLKKTPQITVFCASVLIFSAAFKDYATSGLENSFSYLLCALFFFNFFSDRRNVPLLTVLTGLILLNRMDTVLLIFPAWAYACAKTESKRSLLWVLPVCLAPFWIWEVFCLVYYGFLFPNTAYAKLNTGIPKKEYLEHGINYFKFTACFDFATIAGTIAGLYALFRKPLDGARACAGTGIALYLLYILYAGGDFMGGRFFAVPLFVCLFVFPYGVAKMSWTATGVSVFAVFLLSKLMFDLNSFYPPISATCQYPWEKSLPCNFCRHDICSEKAYWANFTAEKFARGNRHSLSDPLDVYIDDSSGFSLHLAAGFTALSHPSNFRLVDIYGLTDALVSRLPALYQNDWRTGHISRLIPKGFFENDIRSPAVARYSEKIRNIVSGDLFTVSRFKDILSVNSTPPPVKAVRLQTDEIPQNAAFGLFGSLAVLSAEKIDLKALQSVLTDFDIPRVSLAPILLKLDKPSHCPRAVLEKTNVTPASYTALRFEFGNSETGKKAETTVPHTEKTTVSVPPSMVQSGYDLILIVPESFVSLKQQFSLLKQFTLSD